MKQYTIYLALYLAFILTNCQNSNNSNDNPMANFDPVEVKFTQDLWTGCNQTTTVNGVKLSYIAHTNNENDNVSDIGQCDFEGALGVEDRPESPFFEFNDLALAGGFGVLEIDFSDLDGVQKISIAIENNCGAGCTQANLYEGNTIVATTANVTNNPQTENLVFDNLTSNASKVRVWSGEASIYQIKFE